MYQIRKFKIHFIILIGFFISISFMPLHKIYASANTNPYKNDKLSLSELEEKYHTRMNSLFNKKIKLMIDSNGESKAPEGDDCTEDNYTTFCVATESSKELTQYQEILLERMNQVELEDDKTIIEISANQKSKQNEINKEIQRSKRALDATLKAYDELRVAYPMHKQYQETIKNLTEYKKKMSKYRQEVELLPGKFIDATTAECT